MKKAIILAMFLMISAVTFGQGVNVNSPYIFNNSIKLTNISTYSSGGNTPLVLNATTNKIEKTTTSYLSGKVIVTPQTISAARDTASGTYFIKLTADRKDTIVLKTSLYSAGQIFQISCTNSSNDSTYIMTSSGNINGASTYWFTGTYKALNLYFDGTNYFNLNKQ